MKKLVAIIFVIGMSVNTSFAKNDYNKKKDIQHELRTELVRLLGTYDGSLRLNVTAEVSFMLNNQNEIVILEVNTEDTNVEYFIKRKLNYRKLSTTNVASMKLFKLPMRVVKN